MFREWRRLGIASALVILPWAGAAAVKTRHYYVQAEDVSWDFAPSGKDLVHGGEVPKP